MASCPNKNTAEYRALQEVYKTELKTNNIIFAWQKAKNTDVFPSVNQANTFLKNNKTAYALKQRSFGVSVIQNLRRKGLIHNYKGYYLIMENKYYQNCKILVNPHPVAPVARVPLRFGMDATITWIPDTPYIHETQAEKETRARHIEAMHQRAAEKKA